LLQMMIQIPAPDFDLEKTLNSGQVFHWVGDEDGFYGLIGPVPVFARQAGARLLVESGAPATAQAESTQPAPLSQLVRNYFALDHNLAEICGSFPNDPAMRAAAGYCRGLRIIRQPKWECLATFICSSMKQVAHIRQMSAALRSRFGHSCRVRDRTLHTFPSPTRLARTSETQLRRCSLGYRANNLLLTARSVASGVADLDEWGNLSDEELQLKLCTLPGVGPKVANCVMLFGYQRLRVFPIDVWIERVIREQYFARKRRPTPAGIRAFTTKYFGDHGGYAQQYLFHHARTARRIPAQSRKKRPKKGGNRRDRIGQARPT
jgi:N-glycosylase/DNA lyase